MMTGVNANHTLLDEWAGYDVENTFGTQIRNDNMQVGLFHTVNRQVIGTTRLDNVDEASAGFYYENTLHWTDRFRTIAGIREDEYVGSNQSDLQANSGSVHDRIVSPKLGLVLGPWARTEYYANWGRGFHSNDVRGTTITVDPSDGVTPQGKVPLLVQVSGTEVGVRTSYLPRLQSSLAVFQYDQKSELVFSGDAGNTETSRPSRRQGIEITNRYAAASWLNFNADFAYTQARFTDPDNGLNDTVTGHPGNHIPGAVEGVGSFGAAIDNVGPYYGGILMRYFGSRPLIEDNSVRSRPTELIEARVGYKLTDSVRLQLDGFNLLNRKDSNISYYYESQLKGEATSVNDIHLHPIEPRFFRLTLSATF
jgi:outer membrane receptor for Fe3+-dicitrate